MSILDVLLALVTVVIFIQIIFMKKNFHHIIGWLVLDVVVVILHINLDVVRWQILLMYILPIGVIVYYLVRQIEVEKIKVILSRTVIAILMVMNIVSIVMMVIVPIPTLEAPTGDYHVGTTLLNLEDHERQEIYGTELGDRDIRCQFWYPTDETRTDYEKWFIDGDTVLPAIADAYGLPDFFFNHLRYVKSYSLLDASISDVETSYPIIILSHGWSSVRNFHNDYAENLASHGYIVIAIDHTYSSAVTRLVDGSIVKYDESILPDDDFLDEAFELIHVYSDDIAFVRDSLINLNEQHRVLKTKFDLETVGLLGHSTGAGADVYYAMNNDVNAVVGMDPWVEPILDIRSIESPFLVFRSSEWEGGPNDVNLKVVTSDVYQLKKSTHHDFTLVSKLSPILKVFGRSGGDTSLLQKEWILNFFNHHLKGQRDDSVLLLKSTDLIDLKSLK